MITMQYVKTATKLGWKQMSDLNPDHLDVMTTLKLIRLIRRHTLKDVEDMSNGEFTIAALGSYERNFRSITLKRLLRLCNVYGVSIDTVIRHSMYGSEMHLLRRGRNELRTTA